MSKEVKALMFLGLVFLNPYLFAQTSKVDSLKSAYKVAEQDTTKAKLLVELSENIYLLNADSVIPLCQRAIEIIDKNFPNASPQKEISFLHIKASALNNIGFIHQQHGEIDKALRYFSESLKIYEGFFLEEILKKWKKSMDDQAFLNGYYFKVFKKGLADAYNNIGHIYKIQGEIEKALEYLFLCLKIREEIKDKEGMAQSYNNIGGIYYVQEEIEKALEYYFLSLKIREEIKDKIGMAISYNNIGFIYDDQGEIEKALKYYFLSLKIFKEIKYKKGMADSYHNIGGVLYELDSLEEGLRYMGLGLEMAKELEYKVGVSYSNSSMGGLQLKIGEVELALESGLQALTVAKEIGHVEYIKRAAGLLSDVYKKQGKFEDALSMYELEIQMRDSILNEENTKSTIRQQMKYEHEKEQIIKEQQEIEHTRIQVEVTSRRNNLHYSAMFISILILFGGVLMLGFVKIRPKDVEGIIFISFLILFEFVLVLADPHIEQYTGGAPGYKLLFNAGIAGLMFPLHQFFEGKLKMRVIKIQRKKIRARIEQYRKDTEKM
ncbi:MAG: hypothetical protein COC01_01575 [Bacteroidetes bacterium]|nr:MAG: hypothetical protein COC01_01575 [Bacteroidota bacterium]